MGPRCATAEEPVAWEIVEPATTDPVHKGYVHFSDEGETQLSEQGIKRRDPSDAIKVGGTYHVWYTKIVEGTEGFPGGWGGTIWSASSPDGYTWTEQGQALGNSPNPVDWDSHGVYTPNIAIYKGRYFLAYTAQSDAEPQHVNRRAGIGIAVSSSPAGPWEKLAHNPAIPPGGSLADFGTQWDGSRPAWGLKMTGTGLQRFSITWPDAPD